MYVLIVTEGNDRSKLYNLLETAFMSKITLSNINGGYDLSKINTNFQLIADEFNNKVLYRNNPIGEANTLQSDIDLNGKRLYNAVSSPSTSDLVTRQWVEDNFNADTNAAAVAAAASAAAALVSETNAATSETNATLSASNAATSEANADVSEANALASEIAAAASAASAAVYSSLGLGGASGWDLGSITDLVVVFPTDLGTIV